METETSTTKKSLPQAQPSDNGSKPRKTLASPTPGGMMAAFARAAKARKDPAHRAKLDRLVAEIEAERGSEVPVVWKN